MESMKYKLKEYIDTIFADAERRSPRNQRLIELKEEILRNLEEKYDDLIVAGRAPATAYNIAVAGVGDISDLLDSVSGVNVASESVSVNDVHAPALQRPLTPEERAAAERYRRRSAIVTPIAIALYILCAVPCIIVDNVIGVVLMFVMVAVATAMLIYNSMSRPKFEGNTAWHRNDDDDDDDDDKEGAAGYSHVTMRRPRRSPVYKAVSGALWCVTVCVYLLVSFLTGYWWITWMIFLMTTAIDNIIKAIFDLRR